MVARILVPGRVAPPGKAARHEVTFAGLRYLQALERAGAFGFVVAPSSDMSGEVSNEASGEFLDRLLDGFDGVLLLGGPDVAPARYGAAAHPATYGVREAEDAFEIAVLGRAIERGLPVLAICRGAQVLNVARGGTLVQHLGDLPGVVAHAAPAFPAMEPGGIGPIVEVALDPASRVAQAMGTTCAAGAHSHHQAIDAVGGGLLVVGRAADGVVEAVELDDPDRWVVAVQWHPEDTAATDPSQQRLFDAFVARACPT